MKTVSTLKAPKVIGPYSQAIVSGSFVFCSGQIGVDPKTGVLKDGIEKQTEQVLNNLKNVLLASGSNIVKVIKTTIYLKRISDYKAVNSIYEKFFNTHKPARTTVEVSNLPKGALIEIDCIAQNLL